ncbi:MAG: hypothetical protein JWO51_110 [Rhodospirillales bacterium]|nr:hypothetical protein [Rhodospirillales bacterium]
MCQCTPNIKTPFCGKPGCERPPDLPMPPTTAAQLRKQADALHSQANRLNDQAAKLEREQVAEKLRANEKILVDRSSVTLTNGAPVPDDHREIDPATGMQKGYVVLSADERAKGFVRSVRRSYQHVGLPAPKNPMRDLTEHERQRFGDDFVKFEVYPDGPERRAIGRFWTQAEIDRMDKGCGTVTTMGQALAETYARDPKFYGGTFCAGCGTHFPVGEKGEFVWDGTSERVGT